MGTKERQREKEKLIWREGEETAKERTKKKVSLVFQTVDNLMLSVLYNNLI